MVEFSQKTLKEARQNSLQTKEKTAYLLVKNPLNLFFHPFSQHH